MERPIVILRRQWVRAACLQRSVAEEWRSKWPARSDVLFVNAHKRATPPHPSVAAWKQLHCVRSSTKFDTQAILPHPSKRSKIHRDRKCACAHSKNANVYKQGLTVKRKLRLSYLNGVWIWLKKNFAKFFPDTKFHFKKNPLSRFFL